MLRLGSFTIFSAPKRKRETKLRGCLDRRA